MKKIFLLLLAVCMIATVLCVSAFATEAPASDVVLRISTTKQDGTTVVIADHTNFEDGWNAAMELASNSKELNKNGYGRIVVDIYSDWNAVDGEFTDEFFNGKGFNWDAIYFPKNVKVTLNLNGHTINRGLTTWQYNGEVMYIDKKADVIINDGTITGGWSCNGAGGIHVNDNANVTLNNVHVDGNHVDDDDGAAIALYDGATLTMNGGSISDNVIYNTSISLSSGNGALYVNNSTAILNNVTFSGNAAQNKRVEGLAIFVSNGSLIMDKCIVENNGLVNKDKNYVSPISLIGSAEVSNVTITNTEFRNNGTDEDTNRLSDVYSGNIALIRFNTTTSGEKTIFNMENCNFTGNAADVLLEFDATEFTISDCTATNNAANVMYIPYHAWTKGVIKNCSFENNSLGNSATRQVRVGVILSTFHFYKDKADSECEGKIDVTFEDCAFGNATFTNEKAVNIVDTSKTDWNIGSMLGGGNLAMIFSLFAILAACAAIGIVMVKDKKNASIFAKLLAAHEKKD